MEAALLKTEFTFDAPDTQEAVGSVLYEEHLKRVPAKRLAPFAGYLMPLWFSSIQEEHRAVRTCAGLFDCTHMGSVGFSGPHARDFINVLTTNNVKKLANGQAQYSYVLDTQGNVLDDIIVYRRTEEDFLWIVNAGNAAKIKAYIQTLLAGDPATALDYPPTALQHKPVFRDLSDTLVDIALQGPASLDILQAVTDDTLFGALLTLRPFRFLEGSIRNVTCVIARTGYTGAKLGFELLVSPQQAPALWTLLLTEGEPYGLAPCGLGARDSLRIEAGLPLYGHELAGQHQISPFEAGYGWAVKLDKPFFMGKSAMQKIKDNYTMKIARLTLPGGKGIRPVRENDPVLDDQANCMGWILSSATAEDRQIALAYVDRDRAEEGRPIGVYYLARSQSQIKQGRRLEVKRDESAEPDLTGRVLTRFEKF